MASFRRAQSPVYNKYQYNGGSSTSSSLKSLGMFFIRLLLRFLLCFSRFLAWVLFQRYPPKKGNFFTWKWSLKRFLICFTFGFVIGLIPFISPFDDITTSKDFSFEIKQQQQQPLSTRAQMDLNNVVRRENAVLENLILETKPEVEDDKLSFISPRKQLIIVTPTYNRAMQAYFLNRLSQVLRLVPPPVLWIVVEMSKESIETSEILRKTGVMYRHLVCMKNSTNVKDRGVHQRNTALEHIEHHKLDGIVYFADDDNVYALALFESLREISRFGTWPVAMLAPSKNKAILEGPVCNGSQVIGWHTNEKSKRLRRFHVDMSGFAFNSTILWNPKRWHRPTSDSIRQLDTVKEGFQETTFIEQIIEDESQMEPIPYQCLRIMNWHVHLEGRNFVYPRGWQLQKNLVAVVPLH